MAAPKRPTRPTVGEAVDKYVASLLRREAAGRFSPRSRAAYEADLRDFAALAGEATVLDDLEAEDLEDILAAFARMPDRRFTESPLVRGAKQGRSVGSQARFAKTMSTLFTYAARQSWITLNPMPDVAARPRPEKVTAAGRGGLPVSSAAALLASPAHDPGRPVHHTQERLELRDQFVLRVLMEVGPRVSELVSADRADLQERDGTVWLNIRRGKGGKQRAVPLSQATVDVYRRYESDERPEPNPGDPDEVRKDSARALLLSHRGRRLGSRDVQRLVAKHVGRTDPRHAVHVVPHGLRHTAATLLLASGAASVAEVRDILGHASLATTGIYTDAFPEGMARAVSAGPVAQLAASE